MKKLLKIFVFVVCFFCCWFVWAKTISIIPKWDNVWDIVRSISTWGKVWSNYRDTVKDWWLTPWQQFASWIMSWDTILDYCVYLAKFLWQVALLVWALALIYLWYNKIWKSIKPESPKEISKIIVWILVIIFAYVIVKIIWSAFIS